MEILNLFTVNGFIGEGVVQTDATGGQILPKSGNEYYFVKTGSDAAGGGGGLEDAASVLKSFDFGKINTGGGLFDMFIMEK